MANRKEARVSFGLSELADTFQLKINLLGQCAVLDNWLNTTSTFTEAETLFLEDLYLDVRTYLKSLNILRGSIRLFLNIFSTSSLHLNE